MGRRPGNVSEWATGEALLDLAGSLLGSTGQPNYAAAKAGIAALTVTTARACARYGRCSSCTGAWPR